MKTKLKEYFLFGGLSEQDFTLIKKEIINSNRQCMKTYSTIGAGFMLTMIFLAAFIDTARNNLPAYLAGFAVMVIILLQTTVFFEKTKKLVAASAVLFVVSLFAFGIVIGTVTNGSDVSTTYIVALVAVPLIVYLRPVTIDLLVVVSTVVYSVMVVLFADERIIIVDVVNAIVFSGLSCILSAYFTRVKLERLLNAKKMETLSQTDLLTGIYNRNKYENTLSFLQTALPASLCCVYIDVNGLHELNNTKGHAAGDIMLKYIAASLCGQFGESNCYRIGGDEFVVLLDSQQQVTERIEALTAAVESKGYHISVGFAALTESSTVIEMIKQAEQEMYQNKEAYYASIGRVR